MFSHPGTLLVLGESWKEGWGRTGGTGEVIRGSGLGKGSYSLLRLESNPGNLGHSERKAPLTSQPISV